MKICNQYPVVNLMEPDNVMEMKFKIFRFGPQADQKPYYQTYTVSAAKIFDTDVDGTSDLITVNPAGADSLLYLAGSDTVNAGAASILRASVVDTFGNAVSSEQIQFLVRQGGDPGTKSRVLG